MPIAARLAAVLVASSLAGADVSGTPAVPPITIAVVASNHLPRGLVSRVLAETDAVWRTAGVSFTWRRVAAPPAWAPPAALRVVVGEEKGASLGPDQVPLGWIVFEDDTPEQEIYLSYANAAAYMESAGAVMGSTARMTPLERDTKLARAMGRALAHEIGHFLLASKAHTATGLMQATHTATGLFDRERAAFTIDVQQRQLITARLREQPLVVRR